MKFKNKIALLVIGLALLVTIGIGIFKLSSKEDLYESVLSRIDNNETFAFLVSKSDSFSMKSTFEYYSDAYSFPIVFLTEDDENKFYKELIKLIGVEELNENEIIFQLVDKGDLSGSLVGYFDELYIKNLLMDSGYIDKSYKDVDIFINSDFKKYYALDKTYNVLYVGEDDSNYYKYRKVLVKNKIPSLVVLIGASNADTVEYLEKETGIKSESDLPAIIRIKNNKIITHYKNVSLDNLVSKCK